MVEAAPVRSRMTHCSFDSVASGSEARSTKVRDEHKTCSHVRLLTGALSCIPNREVGDAHITRHEEGFDNLHGISLVKTGCRRDLDSPHGQKVQCGESQRLSRTRPQTGGEPTMRKGSYSEELVRNKIEERVAGTPVQEIGNFLKSSVVQLRVVISGAPDADATGRKRRDVAKDRVVIHEMDAASHTFFTLTSSFRVDKDPRAPSDW